MDAQTYDNVLTAMRGEAVAHARYLLFAAAARKHGETRLASMFDGIAAVEMQEHLRNWESSPDLSEQSPTTSAPRSWTRTARWR